MEYSPNTNTDQNESTDEGEKFEKKKKKKTTTIPRYVPLGIAVEKDKDTAEDKPKILSIGEGLLQQLKAKPEKDTDDVDDEIPETQDDNPDLAKADSDEAKTADISTEPDEKLVDEETEPKDIAADKENLEAAEWDEEGELNEDSEVNLGSHRSSETDKSAEEPTEEFAEVPEEKPAADTEEEPAIVEPELLERGLGAEGPPEPPEDVPPPAREVPESERSDQRDGGSAWYNAAAADRLARERADEEAVNDAEYRGEKRGLRRGVASGLLFGWLLGRHGKKKAEKAHTKELKAKDKEIAGLTREQSAARERIESIKRTQEQLQSNIQKEGVKQATEALVEVKRPSEVINPPDNTSKTPENVAAVGIPVAERIVNQEQAQPKSAKELTTAEKLPENQEITEDTYKAKEGRRIETSAWHRIEIDEKTGKPVENPDVAYGKEFEQEQRQERLKEDRKLAGAGIPASALGGLAASSAANSSSSPSQSGTVYKAQDTGDLVVNKPDKDVHEHLSAGNELLHYASHPLTWVIAAVIVIALFAIGALR